MEKENRQKLFLISFWTIFSLPVITLAIIFILISNGKMGFMPSFEELENPKSNLASEVYSDDGNLLGKYYYQNRSSIDFDELSPNLVQALIAIEDIRFKDHSGIDAKGLARVFVKTIILGHSAAGGGSTITQQLAKNLFRMRERSQPADPPKNKFESAWRMAIIKFKEWVTAVRLERNYTKREILVMYLNTVFFGSNSYGIKSATSTFFNTTPDALKVEEAALLAGVVNAPTRYNPVLNPEASIERRNLVLAQMHKYGFLNKTRYDSIKQLPLGLKYMIKDQNQGLAAYLRSYLRTQLSADKPERDDYWSYTMFKEDSMQWIHNPMYGWCNKHKKPNGDNYNLYRDGLKIHTTINYKMQKYAEEAVKEHLGENLQPVFFKEKEGLPYAPFAEELEDEQREQIILRTIKRTRRYRSMKNAGCSMDSIMQAFHKPVKMKVFAWGGEKDTIMSPYDSILYYKHFLRVGMMSMEPHTGFVKAYVGGPNFKHFKYDHVTMGKRQVGSTIKPFLYTLAMQEDYSPCYKVPNVPQTFVIGDSVWSPKNSGITGYEGEMVTLKWGLTHSVNFISAWLVKQFNPQSVVNIIKKMGIESRVLPVPSVILGTSEISLYEMVGAFNTFANKGFYIEPIFVSRIEDKYGNLITDFKPRKKEVISQKTAYLMISLLQNVVNRGTGIRLRLTYEMENEIAGKTGTTQNQSDGWFMGLTPNLVTGVWVGGEDRSIHFNSIREGQGANMALPIWALYMQRVYNDGNLGVTTEDVFEKPEDFSMILDCNKFRQINEEEEYEILDEKY